MANPSFVICHNNCGGNASCCCQQDLAAILRLFDGSGINVSLFGIKSGGNFAPGQALASGIIPDNGVSDDIVTIVSGKTKTVVSICALYGIVLDITDAQANRLAFSLCSNETESCCCNGGLSEELNKYKASTIPATKDDTQVTLEFEDTTNNPNPFYILKVCNNLALLQTVTGGSRYVIVPLCILSKIETEITN